jgi:hypothetical protein
MLIVLKSVLSAHQSWQKHSLGSPFHHSPHHSHSQWIPDWRNEECQDWNQLPGVVLIGTGLLAVSVALLLPPAVCTVVYQLVVSVGTETTPAAGWAVLEAPSSSADQLSAAGEGPAFAACTA